jgi:hypothetical protein
MVISHHEITAINESGWDATGIHQPSNYGCRKALAKGQAKV